MAIVLPKGIQIIEDISTQEKEKIITPLKNDLDTIYKLRDNLFIIMGMHLSYVKPEDILSSGFHEGNANRAYVLMREELALFKSPYEAKVSKVYKFAYLRWNKIHTEFFNASCTCDDKSIDALANECRNRYLNLKNEVDAIMSEKPKNLHSSLWWMLNICDKHLANCSGDNSQKNQGYQPGKDKYDEAIAEIAKLRDNLRNKVVEICRPKEDDEIDVYDYDIIEGKRENIIHH